MKKSVVRSIRVEENLYNELLGRVEKSGLNFNEYMVGLIRNGERIVIRDVIQEKVVEVPQMVTVSINDSNKSGKVYKLGKDLPREMKDGLYRVTTDFVIGDEVYINKV